ncbi:hypothetical protein IWW39_005925 [Coemansia spiralis]|uniref:SAP30-binding protein n=1 Tax=Coemansia spiralis TaxID=417178 RepID=A0A9W8GEH7_9FUNG|nr:hypothetical protein IWW39_005925 [Coemansia spiralis]
MQRMESEPNALLAALGGYDSDDSDSNSKLSSNSEAKYPQPPPIEGDDAEYESDSDLRSSAEEAESDRGSESGKLSPSSLHENTKTDACANEADQAAYEKTKRDLDHLLGCSQVPDIAPQPDAVECPAELQAKFAQWYDLKQQGANFNETLMRNKTFRNPNIYQWLVDHLGLEEAGSNMPLEGFSPAELREDFTPEALAEEQDRRAREVAAKKSADAAAGNLRKMNFNSAGHTAERPASTLGRDEYRASKYDRYDAPQSRVPASSSTLAISRQAPTNTVPEGNTIEDAIQRAKQIAQHLVGTRKQ